MSIHLDVCLVNVPTLSDPAFRRRRRLSIRDGVGSFVSQSRTASWLNSIPRIRNISGQITQTQFVLEAPEDHQRDDVGRKVLSAVENSTAALVELLSTNTAPEAARNRAPFAQAVPGKPPPRRTQCTAFPSSPTRADHTPAGLYQASRSWRDG